MIKEFRDMAEQAVLSVTKSVHRTLPDDVSDLPTVVIGRPSISPSDQLPGNDEIDLTVFVLGSRHTHRSSSDALDDLASRVYETLYKADLRAPGIPEAHVTSLTAALTPVAGLDYPCYMVSIVGIRPVC